MQWKIFDRNKIDIDYISTPRNPFRCDKDKIKRKKNYNLLAVIKMYGVHMPCECDKEVKRSKRKWSVKKYDEKKSFNGFYIVLPCDCSGALLLL